MGTSTHHPSGPARRGRPLLAAGAVVLLTAAVGACGQAGSPQSASSVSSPAPGSPSASAPATAPSGSSATPPSATSGPPGSAPTATGSASPHAAQGTGSAGVRCTVTDLRMRLGAADPGAGNVYFPLRFTNTSGSTCTLDGYPGVSLIRGDGSTIGRPADRMAPSGHPVRVAPGKTVEADLHTLNEGIKSGGCWRTPTFLKVYPPGSTASMTLATSSPRVCGDTFDIGAVH